MSPQKESTSTSLCSQDFIFNNRSWRTGSKPRVNRYVLKESVHFNALTNYGLILPFDVITFHNKQSPNLSGREKKCITVSRFNSYTVRPKRRSKSCRKRKEIPGLLETWSMLWFCGDWCHCYCSCPTITARLNKLTPWSGQSRYMFIKLKQERLVLAAWYVVFDASWNFHIFNLFAGTSEIKVQSAEGLVRQRDNRHKCE